MKYLGRTFRYVWPQWPQVIVVVVCALLVALMLSMSVLTMIPILRVMLTEEGAHGWLDRKVCSLQYGIKFANPENEGLLPQEVRKPDAFLLITKIENGSPAEQAKLEALDQVVGVGNKIVDKNLSYNRSELLEEFATWSEPNLPVQIVRLEDQQAMNYTVTLTPLPEQEQTGFLANTANIFVQWWNSKLLGVFSWASTLLPRDQQNRTKAIFLLFSFVFILTVIRCFAKFYQSYLAQKIVQVGVNHLREDIYQHALNMPMAYYADERPSDMISRIVRDTSVMGKAIKIMLGKALREPLNALFFLGCALFLNWKLTLIFICAAPLILGMLGLFGRKMRRATKKSLLVSSQMLSKLQETMAGLHVVKVYNAQSREAGIFRTINSKLLKQLLKISKVDAATHPAMEVLGISAMGGALILGAHWVNSGEMGAPDFLVFIGLLGMAAEAIRKTSDIWNKIQEAEAAGDRVFGVLDNPLEPDEKENPELGSLTHTVEFRDVHFTYPGSNRPVLTGVNLTAKAGQTVAIVGPNGSGKTTLLNLLPRFYNLNQGQILIDGQDIRNVQLSSLRKQIALVTQKVITFNMSIAENICYGRFDASRGEIVDAAKRAFAHEFIEPLPNGYDTIIGEQGAGLSGGQLQRIVIARAILTNPSILIFDEATSQIDADSEAKIHDAVEKIMKDRTTFLIAHRFSTVISADVIVVMDKGHVAAQGQHEELMKESALYRSLYETQLMGS